MLSFKVGIMTAYHTYFVTSLDLHLVELEDFKYGGTNITAFRLVDPGQRGVQASNEDAFLSICDHAKNCLNIRTFFPVCRDVLLWISS